MGFLGPWNGSLDFAHSLKVRPFITIISTTLNSNQKMYLLSRIEGWVRILGVLCLLQCAPVHLRCGETESGVRLIARHATIFYIITLNNDMFFPPFCMYLLLQFAASLLIFLTWVILLGIGCHAGNSLVFSFSTNEQDGCAGLLLPTPCIFSTFSHRLLAPVF